jgi:hypothetical protein
MEINMERVKFQRKPDKALSEWHDTATQNWKEHDARKNPQILADQMEKAAKMHQNQFWSKLMQDGADMIRKLA